jgi:hypothetical protein
MDADLKAALLAAYGRILTPLVRILLREGVAYPELDETVRKVFVSVALEMTLPRARDQIAGDLARIISSATGLSVAEVSRISEDRTAPGSTGRLEQITAVLTAWHTDPNFTGPYGLPLELRFDGNDGRDFVSLVSTHCPTAAPDRLLSELRHVGIVKETDSGWFKVLTRTYLPRVDVPDSFERIGRAVQCLVDTVDFNRQQVEADARLLERTVHADDGIRTEDLPRFRSYVRDRAQVLLEEIDNWLSQLDKPDLDSSGVRIGTGVGIYHYVEWPVDDQSKHPKAPDGVD